MHLVLTYDVVRDSDRARFHRHLKQWLLPVQRSAFEGRGDARVLANLEALVHENLDLRVDNVRIYLLCAACAARVRCHGVAHTPQDPDHPRVW